VTRFRCDGIFNDSFIAYFQEIVKVKNFENRSVFDEVMPKILLVRFFPDTVYSHDHVYGTVIMAQSLQEFNQSINLDLDLDLDLDSSRIEVDALGHTPTPFRSI